MVLEVEDYIRENDLSSYGRESFDQYCQKTKLSLNVPVIHVAGSNGKGSFCHYLESIYLKEGYKVGSFIKPAFYEVNECIRAYGKPIEDDALRALFLEHEKEFRKYGLTAFEATVVLAYSYFNSLDLDLVIVEAGMGGAIDATNIERMNTVLSVITSISLEHTSYLGTTLSQIALHKAGIIKHGSIVLTGKTEEDALSVLREVAKEEECPLSVVDDPHFERFEEGAYHFDYGPYKDLVVKTGAKYQIKNASLAIEAVSLLKNSFPVKEESIRLGIKEAPLPGRFELCGRVLFDGAHNPEGVQALVESLAFEKPIHALFASFKDKNIAVELPALASVVSSLALTTFPHVRSRTEEDYFLYLGDFPFYQDPLTGLGALLAEYPEDLILVTGSLAFVGYLKKQAKDKGLIP